MKKLVTEGDENATMLTEVLNKEALYTQQLQQENIQLLSSDDLYKAAVQEGDAALIYKMENRTLTYDEHKKAMNTYGLTDSDGLPGASHHNVDTVSSLNKEGFVNSLRQYPTHVQDVVARSGGVLDETFMLNTIQYNAQKDQYYWPDLGKTILGSDGSAGFDHEATEALEKEGFRLPAMKLRWNEDGSDVLCTYLEWEDFIDQLPGDNKQLKTLLFQELMGLSTKKYFNNYYMKPEQSPPGHFMYDYYTYFTPQGLSWGKAYVSGSVVAGANYRGIKDDE